jgi:hypothetical protein
VPLERYCDTYDAARLASTANNDLTQRRDATLLRQVAQLPRLTGRATVRISVQLKGMYHKNRHNYT